MGVAFEAALRDPLSARPEDWAKAQRIIALSRIEHQPMVEQYFPADAARVEYWEVGDLPVASPDAALEHMTCAVQELMAALVGEI
ncbi:MAG: hypothetical protein HC889_19095 [Synechococcaceae cyanobacterium SM1_2_3]|nr:hypothetical protein [Synechococcaceae cyanobacterium SM1_2_3]